MYVQFSSRNIAAMQATVYFRDITHRKLLHRPYRRTFVRHTLREVWSGYANPDITEPEH